MGDELETLVVLGDTTFTESKTLKAGKLRFLANSTIKITNGSVVRIECDTLILDGALLIDARGENGKDGIPGLDRPDWISDASRGQDEAHWQWQIAVWTENLAEHGGDAIPGTDGGDAGSFLVAYRRLGDGVSLGDIKALSSGGQPGAPAKGGLGQLMVCGRASDVDKHRVRRPNGRSWQGQKGRDGHVDFFYHPTMQL